MIWSLYDMKVGILLVTHSDIGKQLLLTATSVFGKNPFQVELLSVDNYDQPNDVRELAEKYVKFLDNGAGVLVLTDIIGTTPSNIASSINHKKIKIVAGLNLSMILNVFNYPEDSLDQLSIKAVEGGIQGVSKI
jgi:PTS system ascorbate-specific IIA component|tara:strand:- start:1880 stop:2281 length:402 start_codon:yes stop_codon:yes gene_type:complete